MRASKFFMNYSHRLAIAILLASLSSLGVSAERDNVLFSSRTLESATLSLLAEQYGFEERLSSPDSDQVVVFLSVPHGARVIVDQVDFKIDGNSVAIHTYGPSELLNFQQRGIHVIYAGKLSTGKHRLRLDVKTMQGTVKPMKDYSFVKEDSAKFIDIQIAGYQIREVFVADAW